MERTWEISDIDGRNKRRVTLAQYRAELDAQHRLAKKIFARNKAQMMAHSKRVKITLARP